MPRQITDPKKGVAVKISPDNSKKVLKVIGKTRRTFSNEVNIAVEEKMDEQIQEFKDDRK